MEINYMFHVPPKLPKVEYPRLTYFTSGDPTEKLQWKHYTNMKLLRLSCVPTTAKILREAWSEGRQPGGSLPVDDPILLQQS